MELRIWQYGIDDAFIDSWLEGQALAHHFAAPKKADWFHWKFEQSPFGRSILACAFDDKTVAGCVAYGMGIVNYRNKQHKCALSYETYVRPEYQGQGLFKKLINLAEQESIRQKIEFLYNYPNSNSLPGFLRMNWIGRNDKQVYMMKLIHPIKSLLHFGDIRKSFSPNPSNLQSLDSNSLSDVMAETPIEDTITPIWTAEYLKWRFFTYPNREYYVVNNDDCFAISMVGKRGILFVAHILYAVSKKDGLKAGKLMKIVVRDIKQHLNPDIVCYSTTIDDVNLKGLKYFIKVPGHSNFCYKVLNESFVIDDLKISLPAINAHTY